MTEEQMKILNDICFSMMLNYNRLNMLLQTPDEEGIGNTKRREFGKNGEIKGEYGE